MLVAWRPIVLWSSEELLFALVDWHVLFAIIDVLDHEFRMNEELVILRLASS